MLSVELYEWDTLVEELLPTHRAFIINAIAVQATALLDMKSEERAYWTQYVSDGRSTNVLIGHHVRSSY